MAATRSFRRFCLGLDPCYGATEDYAFGNHRRIVSDEKLSGMGALGAGRHLSGLVAMLLMTAFKT
jgi:hypothetical protein